MNNQYIIWGGTGQAKVLNEALKRQGDEVNVIVDNCRLRSPLDWVPIVYGITGLDEWLKKQNDCSFYGLVAIGGGHGRDRLHILDIFKQRKIKTPYVVHETAYVAIDASIEDGSQILAKSAICSHVKIGRGVIVNTSASVDHDCIIGNGVHIAPGAVLSGCITVEDHAFIGAGAVVLPNITIGKNAVIGAGAVVTRNIPPSMVVKGNPAR